MVDNMKIFKKAFWIIIIALFVIATIEFYRIRNGNDPIFCVYKTEHNFNDGKVLECIGLGYKVYEYRRTNLHGTEFVSIFASMKEPEQSNNYEPFNSGELK